MTVSAQDAHEYPIYNSRFRLIVPLLDADGDPVSPSSPDTELSQDMGTFADATNEATEIATSSGIIYVDLIATELDTKSTVVRVQSTGAKTTVAVLTPRRLPVIRTGTAQAGAASTMTLDSGASAIDDYYTGMWLNCTNDTPSNVRGQCRKIVDYVGSTKVATIEGTWGTTVSSSTTFEVLLPSDAQFRQADVYGLLGTAVSTPATAGILDVNVKNIDNDAASASGTVTFPNATLASTTNITGGTITTVTTTTTATNVTTVNGLAANVITAASIATGAIDADAIADGAIDAGALAADAITAAKIADGAIDSATFAAGAINAAAIAADAITAAKVADGTIDAATFAAGAINAAAIATDAITAAKIAADAIGASELAADAVTEIQSGLATAANLSTVAGYLDTEIAAILADTNELQTDWVDGGRLDLIIDAILTDTGTTLDDLIDTEIAAIITTLGTPAGASISADIAAIEAQTDDIGAAGAGLTALATQASVNTIDDFLDTEIAALTAALNGIVLTSGTIGATGNDTTHLHLSGLAYADDAINSMLLSIKDVSTGLYYSRWIEDFANTGDLATVGTLPFTPEASVDLYWIIPVRADVTGGSGLDAAGVRAAVGLASANLDTQLTTIDDFLDTEVAAIKAKTDNLPTDPADDSDIDAQLATIAGYLDTEIAAIKAKTDNLPASPAATGDIPTAAAIADAVLDEDMTAHQTQGTLGQAIGDPVADSDTIWALINTNLNATVSSRASQTSIDTVDDFLDTEVAAIKAVTDALPNAGALTTIQSDLDDMQTRLPAALVSGRMDASVGAMAANTLTASALASDAVTEIQSGLSSLDAASVRAAVGLASANLDTQLTAIDDAIDTEVAAIISTLATILATVDTEVAAIKAKTDNLPTDPADQSAVEAAILAAWTTALTEAYRGAGATGTPAQLLYELLAHLGESSISGTTKTLKKLDGTTTAKTYTLNSATTPTAITEAT